MNDDLIKRAKALDDMRSKGVSSKLTLEEAQNIVSVWGRHLEHFGAVRILFGTNIPVSLLPYPIDILQGAINKMQAHHHRLGDVDRVKLLEETEVSLIQYTDDEDAINKFMSRFKNKRLQSAIVDTLRNYQRDQAQDGYLVDKKLWRLSRTRLEELQNS